MLLHFFVLPRFFCFLRCWRCRSAGDERQPVLRHWRCRSAGDERQSVLMSAHVWLSFVLHAVFSLFTRGGVWCVLAVFLIKFRYRQALVHVCALLKVCEADEAVVFCCLLRLCSSLAGVCSYRMKGSWDATIPWSRKTWSIWPRS